MLIISRFNNKIFHFVFWICFFCNIQNTAFSQGLVENSYRSDLSVIKKRIRYSYLQEEPLSTHLALSYLSSMNKDGSWNDIDYNDKKATTWKPISHLQRLLCICIAFSEDSITLKMKDNDIIDKINKSLRFWIIKRPVSDNWWWNDIGQQLDLEKIAIISDSILYKNNKSDILIFFKPLNQIDSSLLSGQNGVWFAEQQLCRGIISNNNNDIKGTILFLTNKIGINQESDLEGIQPDYSFHQHGNQLYNGEYGFNFIKDIFFYMQLLHKTQYEFPIDKQNVLIDYFLDGTLELSRIGFIDYNAIGRSISRKNFTNRSSDLVKIIDCITSFTTYRNSELNNIKSNIINRKANSIKNTNTYFWTSDFITQQRQDYYTSVRLFSNRIVGTEEGNGDNEKGFWLPYGNNLIYRTGLEYNNIFAVWDWTKIPGVTSFNRIIPFKGQLKTDNPFAAGCSDGEYGFGAMDVKVESLTAKKAWFMFDNEVVSLGNNISSNEPEEVSTTLNQTLLNGDVIVNGEVNRNPNLQSNLKKNSWIIHNNTGYVFLNPANITLKAGEQSGSWNAINTSYDNALDHKNVFSLWINHGKRIENSSYAYMILPNITPENIKKNYQVYSPIEILSNNSSVQAVRNRNLKITQIVFRQPGGLVFDESRRKINVNKPCLVMIRQLTDGKTQITVANSSYSKQDIKVILEGNKTIKEQTFHYTGNYDENINKTVIID